MEQGYWLRFQFEVQLKNLNPTFFKASGTLVKVLLFLNLSV